MEWTIVRRAAAAVIGAVLLLFMHLADADGSTGLGGSHPPTSTEDSPADEDAFSLHAAARGLFPGGTKALRVSITNPNPFRIRVVEISVRVLPDRERPECSTDQLQASDFARELTVPGLGARDVRLWITMLRSAPDACQGATFPLRLDAWAVGA
jgi:hypothetical protein